MMYLASDPDGGGPWLYSLDLDRRLPHRVGPGIDRYTSLAASADGSRLVLTRASPKETLWRLPLDAAGPNASVPTRISLTTGRGFSPRLGPGFLLYASRQGGSDALWKMADGTATEIWSAPGARIVGSPAVASDGHRIAFSVERGGKTALYVVNADGTEARVVTAALDLRGTPAWAPDGQSITTAANEGGTPRLFTVSLDGRPPGRLTQDYSVNPVWSPDGRFVVYSGADIGTTFPVKAVSPDGKAHPLPNVVLTRGATPPRFLPGHRALVLLRGQIRHKDLWLVDLSTGAERQLTNLPPDFTVQDFDISPDGREVVLHRVQEQSDVVLLELPRR